MGERWDQHIVFLISHDSFPNNLLESLSLLGRKMMMKSRVLQFLCFIHTIYVELPQWNILLSEEGRRVETEINLLNLLYMNPTRT